MKPDKLKNLFLIIASLIGYLEWGENNSILLFQIEFEIIGKIFVEPASMIHPLIILPLLGQIILVFTLFQKTTRKVFTLIGIASIGILFAVIFIAGILSANYKIIISTVPFFFLALHTILYYRKNKNKYETTSANENNSV